MLTYINIKNFAIIKDIEIDLQSEMTCLTGETGAGKSIVIDSIELALGARADTSLIRNNADRCEITVMFDLTDLPYINSWLIDQELDSDNECIIRRIISNDGRSRSSINGYPCTQQTLRKLAELLLNIHGQHEHQNLLSTDHHQKLLDAFADNESLVAEVENLYASYIGTKRKLFELENLTENQSAKIDFLRYQLEELEQIEDVIKNLENLRSEQKRLNNIEEFTSSLSSSLDLLSENNNDAVIDNLHKIKNQLEKCEKIDEQIASTIELIDHAIIHTEEAANSLRHKLNSSDVSQETKQQLEEQLSNIYAVARKHQVQPEELSQIYLNLKNHLETIENGVQELKQVKIKLKQAEITYLERANKLSAKRKIAADKLNRLVTAKMQILGMKGGKFAIKLLPNINQKFNAKGLEKVEFLVSTNPGYPPQPLNKIASGGELSRISLAIHTITAEKEVTPTLIFDEIDAGIGGKIADIAGQLLRQLAKKTQIICITHLAQIAAQAHQHILIEKLAKTDNTEMNLTTLDKNERVKEIARMLGGIKITKQTIAHAKEMLNSVL